jgi:hypothetical protein
MARILVVTHPYDRFGARNYLLRALIPHWRARHEVLVVAGVGDWCDADVAVLHVDLSVVPRAYVDELRRYPRVVNGAALDIRKRNVSRNLVAPGDDWTGPVIVKTDLNCGGMPEQGALEASQRAGKRCDVAPLPMTFINGRYPILRSAADVPPAAWSDRGLVIERFLPECDGGRFATRSWVFFGASERCTRYVADDPIVKSDNIVAREAVAVPEEIRAERERLGFDFGKFDFAIHDGRPVLFDANRTPGAPPPPLTPELAASTGALARGIDAWFDGR